jgi:hypothetical protein
MDDDTVHYKSAGYILKKLRAEKAVCMIKSGGHGIFQGYGAQEAMDRIGEFIHTG